MPLLNQKGDAPLTRHIDGHSKVNNYIILKSTILGRKKYGGDPKAKKKKISILKVSLCMSVWL